MTWVDVPRGRTQRERTAQAPVPLALSLLDAGHVELLRRWVRSDSERRSRAALLKDAGPSGIERAEALCDWLLREGWIARRERLAGGHWQWDALTWRDLPRLQSLLGVASPRIRAAGRQALLGQAQAWLRTWQATREGVLDPDLLDECTRAVEQLETDRASRVEVLARRLDLVRAIASWRDSGTQDTRRRFALHARGHTKSVTGADWRWLKSGFDLERLGISAFASEAMLAGDVVLQRQERRLDLGFAQWMRLPLEDLLRVTAVTRPTRWWLVENRDSFERQARSLPAGTLLAWLPGRPSAAWLQAMAHLLRLAPAPAWVSADIDPAGVDIACTAGALWDAQSLPWEPHEMGEPQLEAATQHWPLNAHDQRLLAVLLARPDLPPALRGLCEAMLREGRKAEQEGWL